MRVTTCCWGLGWQLLSGWFAWQLDGGGALLVAGMGLASALAIAGMDLWEALAARRWEAEAARRAGAGEAEG